MEEREGEEGGEGGGRRGEVGRRGGGGERGKGWIESMNSVLLGRYMHCRLRVYTVCY